MITEEKKIQFSVDAALLRELGERLVGQSHIALAELVKNSYDADAHTVVIRVETDRIEVIDNGHGMSEADILKFWMRVGATHKQAEGRSKYLKRPLTGSKGIGRLSVQFLARKVTLRTVAKEGKNKELQVKVNWDEVVQAGELTRAEATQKEVRPPETKFPDGSSHGTSILLTELNQNWSTEQLEALAREVWMLQPPFRNSTQGKSDEPPKFEVRLESKKPEHVQAFKSQMQAPLDLWHAKLVGTVVDAQDKKGSNHKEVVLSLEFADGTQEPIQRYRVPNDRLRAVNFEIRIFDLKYRQARGVKVSDARDYLNAYGGVHIYDAGFHLPYYGRHVDWLDIEREHSHRLSRSKLLPEELQVREGLNDLPTQSRLFGVVNVNTGRERAEAERLKETEYLTIQVSRDRLVDNAAYSALKHVVRWALDYYAMQWRKRRLAEAEAERPTEPIRRKFERVDQVLSHEIRETVPKPIYDKVRKEVQEAIAASDAESAATKQQMGLMGALATAGMAALGYEHEMAKQFHILEGIARRLGEVSVKDAKIQAFLTELRAELDEWVAHSRATRQLFSYLLDAENREAVGRLKAKNVVDQVKQQTRVLTRDVEIDTSGIDASLRFPPGRFVEWSAILQNVFVNAVNAMLDAREKRIAVRTRVQGKARSLVVLDTGVGVNPLTAEELFKPFVRRLKISPERAALGLGGMGLGLPIVRMLATNLGCEVTFAAPDKGFKTAIEISWSEKE